MEKRLGAVFVFSHNSNKAKKLVHIYEDISEFLLLFCALNGVRPFLLVYHLSIGIEKELKKKQNAETLKLFERNFFISRILLLLFQTASFHQKKTKLFCFKI